MSYSTQFLGKSVTVTIDRPLGSRHPQYQDMVYAVNYGYVSSVTAPDGEDLDAYVLGISEPLISFTGQCIAIIHRLNDQDDKLVVVPEYQYFSDTEIKKITHFQEKFFESTIIRE